jgi:hypothetical protein
VRKGFTIKRGGRGVRKGKEREGNRQGEKEEKRHGKKKKWELKEKRRIRDKANGRC